MAAHKDLLTFNKNGIYCSVAGVYIDPWRKVDKALITHGHSDHARSGSKSYICHKDTLPIIRHRIGKSIEARGIQYGEVFTINGVRFSFHPAGHIIGSSQIRVEYKGEVWVASGDYKIQDDGVCTPFEPIECHAFITESTFGLPIYSWKPIRETIGEMNTWWEANKSLGKPSIISAYSLGKAQNILHNIDKTIGPIYCHGAIIAMNKVLQEAGLFDCDILPVTDDVKNYGNALVLTPGSGINGPWAKRFKQASIGVASGWMNLRGARRRRGVDKGFVLSDHADWDGLNAAIKATGATKVVVTHGYQDIFTRWLCEQGYDAVSEKTLFEGEGSENAEH